MAKFSSTVLRSAIELLAISICTAAFALTAVGIFALLLSKDSAGSNDYVEYWASGHQLINHSNPYSADALLNLEQNAGFPQGTPALVMWNLPSALLLTLPLGFLTPKAGQLLWFTLSIACLWISIQMIWNMYGRQKRELNLLGFIFAPALVCLLAGQVSLFVLLGMLLFFRLHRFQPFLAGVSLWLCMLKPHLFLPFGIVLIIWVMITRSYLVVIGVFSALIISTWIALHYDPLVWSHYTQMAHSAKMEGTIPCISITLRRMFYPHSVWIQYVPATLGCAWAIGYFRWHRDRWNWLEHGPLLILVSVLVAPYAWLMDQAVLILPLLQAAYLTRSRYLLLGFPLAGALIEVGALWGKEILHSGYFLWTAPVWLIWYLCAAPKRTYETRNTEAFVTSHLSSTSGT